MEPLALAALLATANKAIVDFVVGPVRRRFPDADLWWFDYVALASGGVLAWFAGVNLFAGVVVSEVAGRILTAVLIGGGTALLNQVFVAVGRNGLVGRISRGW